ncbi:MAG: metallophosphoesterase [Planctomycetes bacterium]|nr:metallophosphoesterase [Planctomycetota bacterium]
MELAHISDLHVTAPLGPWWGLLNKRLIGALTLLRRAHPHAVMQAAVDDLREAPPDHLAVTGDLTNLALDGEFARARDYLAAVGLPPERLSVIPGNHDGYVRGPFVARRFEHHLAPLLGLAPEALAWPRVQRRDGALFVSVSSCVPTPWFTAYGRVEADQLAALRATLLADDAPFKVVLVHHPPLQGHGGPDFPWRRNLDGRAVIEACHEGGADLLLCGHTHAPFRLRVPGGPKPLLIACAGSTTKRPRALGAAATYNRYRIEGERLVEVEVRGYCPDAGRFVHLRRESP